MNKAAKKATFKLGRAGMRCDLVHGMVTSPDMDGYCGFKVPPTRKSFIAPLEMDICAMRLSAVSGHLQLVLISNKPSVEKGD